MEKLVCESCGAKLEIDDNKEFATCPYCKMKYKLKRDENSQLILDEEIKRNVNNSLKLVSKLGNGSFVMHSIIMIMIFIVFLVIFVGVGAGIFSRMHYDSKSTDIVEKDEVNADIFNVRFEMYSGSESKYSVESLIDNVASSNRKYSDKQITFVFNDFKSSDATEITNLKDTLTDDEYNVALYYDGNGYINRVVLSSKV